jgi:hypothetical protein
MKCHANSQLSPIGRQLLVDRVVIDRGVPQMGPGGVSKVHRRAGMPHSLGRSVLAGLDAEPTAAGSAAADRRSSTYKIDGAHFGPRLRRHSRFIPHRSPHA